MYSKVEISNIVFRGVEVKKSKIRLKSENLHPWTNSHKLCKLAQGKLAVGQGKHREFENTI